MFLSTSFVWRRDKVEREINLHGNWTKCVLLRYLILIYIRFFTSKSCKKKGLFSINIFKGNKDRMGSAWDPVNFDADPDQENQEFNNFNL